MSERWYLAGDGRSLGPFRFDQMRQMVRTGRVTPVDMIRSETAAWVSAGDVPGLFLTAASAAHSASAEAAPQPTARCRPNSPDVAQQLCPIPGSIESPSNPTWLQAIRIAKELTRLKAMVAIYILMFFTQEYLTSIARLSWFLFASVLVGVALSQLARTLARNPLIWGIAGTLPLVNVVLIVILNREASKLLIEAGIRISFLGFKLPEQRPPPVHEKQPN